MLCPKCGNLTRRSRSRHFGESVIKSITPLRFYRCTSCGWRGIQAPPARKKPVNAWKLLLAGLVVLIVAFIVTVFTAGGLAAR